MRRNQHSEPLTPDVYLTPLEALGDAIILSLFNHVPNFQGLTDSQLEAVSRDVIKHLRIDADKILDRSTT